MSNDAIDFRGPANWLSECCGETSLGELSLDKEQAICVGICSRCKDHATFTMECSDESPQEVIRRRAHPYRTQKFTPNPQDR